MKKPAISKADFDAIRITLEREIRDELRAEVKSDATEAEEGALSIWDTVPQVTSLTVACISGAVEKHLGCPLPVEVIRRGGYNSIPEAVGDLSKKLRDLCEDAVSATSIPAPVRTKKGGATDRLKRAADKRSKEGAA